MCITGRLPCTGLTECLPLSTTGAGGGAVSSAGDGSDGGDGSGCGGAELHNKL